MDVAQRSQFELAAEHARALMTLGPLAAPGRLRRLGPFFFVAGCVIASLSFDPDVHVAMALSMSLLSIAVLVADAVLPWDRLPRHAQRIPPLLCVGAIAGFMYVDGGLGSPVLGVIVVPSIWMVMYETLRALYVCLALTFVLLFTEVLVDFHADSLLRSVIICALMLSVFPLAWQMVDQNRVALLALADTANTDPLTGLPNRRGFDRRLFDPLEHDGRPLGVVYLDLNRFKEINDTYGHDAGDDLLVEVGKRIAATTRAGDVCARLGGDEFVIACRGEESHLRTVARRVANAIAATPFRLGESTVSVTAAVGVSHLTEDVLDLPGLLSEADASMYAAKPHRSR